MPFSTFLHVTETEGEQGFLQKSSENVKLGIYKV